MGVFAALSVYISNVPSGAADSEVVDIGVVSSLMITGVIALILLWRIFEKAGGLDGFIQNFMTIKNIDFLIFVIAFLYLIDTLFRIVIGRPETLGVIAITITLIAMLFVFVVGMRFVSEEIEQRIGLTGEYNGVLSAIVVLTVLWTVLDYTLERHSTDVRMIEELNDPNVWEAVSTGALLILPVLRPVIGLMLASGIGYIVILVLNDVGEVLRYAFQSPASTENND